MSQSAYRTAAAGLIGNVLEWFDFAVYGYFATAIGDQFFHSASPSVRHMLAYAVFAVGFGARPIGSIVLGRLGDRIGRRALLTVSIVLMGGATLAIGCLPSYEQIGIAAPILLVAFRLVQGFSLGGEFTGSMVYTTELASPLWRGLISSSTAVGTTLGFILGSLAAWLVSIALPSADVVEWGWRIPFIGSVSFCIAGWFLRRGIVEPEQGKKASAMRPPIIRSLLAAWRPIVQTFGIVAMTNAAYYLAFIFAVERRKSMTIDGTDFQLANTLSLIVVLVAKPMGGWLSDRIGRRRLMMLLTVAVMSLVVFALRIMLTGSPAEFMLGQCLLAVPLGMALGLQGAMVVEIFPLTARVMAMSIAYSITLMLAGGTAPLVSTWMIDSLGWSIESPAYYVMIYGAIGFAIMWPMRETNGRSLDE